MEFGLISCTKLKLNHPVPPKELYTKSAYFQKARAYAEQHHDRWYILSAKHHLLEPDGPDIEPYDVTLNEARKADRRVWATSVAEQMDEHGLLQPNVTLVIHAGRAYYDELLPLLPDDQQICIPTEGLQFGETLSWYNEPLDEE